MMSISIIINNNGIINNNVNWPVQANSPFLHLPPPSSPFLSSCFPLQLPVSSMYLLFIYYVCMMYYDNIDVLYMFHYVSDGMM